MNQMKSLKFNAAHLKGGIAIIRSSNMINQGNNKQENSTDKRKQELNYIKRLELHNSIRVDISWGFGVLGFWGFGA